MIHMPSNLNFTCDPTALSSSTTSNKLAVCNSSSADMRVNGGNYNFICDPAVTAAAAAAVVVPDDTRLSTTVEHYSSASAALNGDVPDDDVNAVSRQLDSAQNANITDTNALFQQLLCSSSLLDELDYDNNTFTERSKCSFACFHFCVLIADKKPGIKLLKRIRYQFIM